MRRRVQRWGNSLAVRIPADLAAACSIAEGSEVEVRQEGEALVLTPEQPRRKRYALARLVSRITRANRPAPIDWGRPRGREVW